MKKREFIRLAGFGAAGGWLLPHLGQAAALAADEAPAAAPEVKYHGAFAELPVGAVQPRGWLEKWLERQAQGLSGHPENMGYPYDTCMFAGVIPPPPVKHGADWWPYEQSGYFFDATARLNQLIDDPGVRHRHDATLDYILAHSTDDSLGASHWGWPNAVVGRGLLADHDATANPAIAALLQRYLVTHAWPGGRDGVNAEEAYALYGRTGDPALLAFARRVYEGYTGHGSFCAVDKINGESPLREHGVTAAEYLKILPLTYLHTGDAQALDLTRRAYDKVFADSAMPDGGIVSSERLGTAAFDSLHESCDITDWSWSMGYCLMATGDARWADRIERAIFNALPGAVTEDFRQVQYFSCANQILTTSRSSHDTRSPCTRMSYRAAHETECCVGNINRAMPNFVIRQWMKTPADDGLAAVLYGPSEVTTRLRGEAVTITQETDYPFRETITFRVKTDRPHVFALHLRIPGWCDGASVSVNGQPFAAGTRAGGFAEVKREWRAGDEVRLRLPMTVRAEEWFGGQSVALTRGPLVFSLEIEEKRVELTRDTPHIESVLKGNLIQGFPAVEFYPQSEWRYGIDPAVRADPGQVKVVESPVTDNPFRADQAPVRLELPLRRLPKWQPDWNAEPAPQPNGEPVAVQTPRQLPLADERRDAEPAAAKRLLPYGATHLRLTTLPLLA